MRDIKLMVGALSIIVILQHYVMEEKINEVKQAIVEIKKDYSYDPKDAK